GGICREFVSLCPVKPVYCPNKAGVALLNQIQNVQAPSGVLLGDGNHQPQVGLGQLVLGVLIALGNPLGQLHFLIGGQELDLTDFLQVHPHRVVQAVFGGQIHRVYQILFFQAGQVDVPVGVQTQVVVSQIQFQVSGDDLNVHGLKAVVNL